MVRPFTHDAWAALSYVEALGAGDGQSLPPGMNESKWLEYDDARRLVAYRILAAKRDNAARYFLPEHMWVTDRAPNGLTELERVRYYLAQLDSKAPAEKWREYGDAALLVEQGISLLLGDAQDVVLPELHEALKELADDEGTGDGEPEEPPALARLRTFDDWVQQWTESERLVLRLMEGEENSVGDGDGVYALGWSERLGRPRLRVYDPGWYFPDLTTLGRDEEYPTTVHVAWESETWDDGTKPKDGHTILHRITWRLVTVGDDHPLAPKKPWRPAYAEQDTDRMCVFSVAEWDTAQLKHGDTVYTLNEATDKRAVVVEAQKALNIDFVPVVHVPNDAAGKRHFGKSILLLVAQALDDVAGTDTDLQANSELVGSTPTVIKGGGPGALDAGPGSQWNLDKDGDAKLLDTSRALLGLTGYARHLRSTVSVNSRISETLLGRVSPAEVPSGYAFDLGFAPTRSLIRKMRLVREEKHPLIPKFAIRLQQVNGAGDQALPGGPTPRVEIALGGYLPADKEGAMKRVTEGLKGHAISTSTGVQMLVEADFPIEDAEAEVDRIRAEAFQDMLHLVEALGADGEDRVREWLGIDVLPRAAVPPLPGSEDEDGGAGGA